MRPSDRPRRASPAAADRLRHGAGAAASCLPRRTWRGSARAALRAAWQRVASPSLLAVALLVAAFVPVVRAVEVALPVFDVRQTEEGVLLDYAVAFELPRAVDDALTKAVPIYFVAEASLFRDRWYWRDRRVAHAVRIWRVVFQPLTSTYRVTFGGLSQTYATRNEALAAVSRATHWKVAEPGQASGGGHYLEFGFRLDTSQLPRPMQIGIGGQADWKLAVERTQRID